MISSRGLVVLAAILALGIAASAAVRSRRSRAHSRPPAVADTIVRPPVNGALNVRVMKYQGRRYFYKVFLPLDYTPKRRWPVIFALHGGLTRGSDNVIQVREGLGGVVQEQAKSFPAVVIFPQVPAGVRGADFIPADMAMLDQEMKAINGDPDRVYVTGSSFGGYTAYQLAYLHPDRFAAIVPVAAATDLRFLAGWSSAPHDSMTVEVARRIRSIPVWMFAGEFDEDVGTETVRRVAAGLKAGGVQVKYTEFKGASHAIFTRAYRTSELYPWLFAQHR